ncbi:calponin-2 isoform X1 [Equus quagga]|uniref:calponin-2 isoform X1 n=1 Tax=Equus quagga TaxID=89248 RepID=UPI001EE1A140|nr:calponin-2 isoform X1 [Equus quagga]
MGSRGVIPEPGAGPRTDKPGRFQPAGGLSSPPPPHTHTLPPGTWECGPTAAAAGDLPGHAEGTAPPAPAGHLRAAARGGRALPVPDPLGRTVPPSSPDSPGCSLAGLPTGLRDAAEAAGTAQLAGGRGGPRPATSCSWPPPEGQQKGVEDKAPQRDRPWRPASRGFEPTARPLYRLLKRRATQRPCRPAPVPQFPPGQLARSSCPNTTLRRRRSSAAGSRASPACPSAPTSRRASRTGLSCARECRRHARPPQPRAVASRDPTRHLPPEAPASRGPRLLLAPLPPVPSLCLSPRSAVPVTAPTRAVLTGG